MSNISLNLTGLDTDTIISNLMALERQPLARLQNKQVALLQKKNAWNVIKTQTGNVSTKLNELLKSTAFSAKTATVTGSAVTAKVTGLPSGGQYQIHVNSLATSQIVQTSGQASAGDPLAPSLSGTITLNGQSITVTAEDSLESLAAKINATKDAGVSASVLQTSPGVYKMVLTSDTTGVDGTMDFGGDLEVWRGLGVLDSSNMVNEIRVATDASFTVNGVSFTRGQNTVTDAILGVSFTLTQAGSSADATISVGFDDATLVANVKAFVTEYNSMIDTVSKYTAWDSSTKTGGLLFGDSMVTGLLRDMRSVIFGGVEGMPDEFRALSLVGFSTGTSSTWSKEGKITFDETKFRNALETNRDAVASLFGAKAINAALSSSGASATGSSTYDPSLYPASSVISGNTSSALWGSGGGWMDGTPGDFSDDRLEIDFGGERTIDRVALYTVDSALYPAAEYGIKDFYLEYWDGSAWVALGDAVAGNTSSYQSISFGAVTTSKIRLTVTDSNDGQNSRVVSVQAFQENTGAFTSLKDTLGRYTAGDGFLANRTAALDAEDKTLQKRIEEMQRRLEVKEASLRSKFTALEVTLQQLNAQSAWLSSQINSLSASSSE